MNNPKNFRFLLCFLILVSFLSSCGVAREVSPSVQAPVASPDIAGIIEKYRQEIPQRMQQENISGLAIAVVDDQNILWTEGFGTTDWDRRTPVTPGTLFSIQSMSKSFTATAAMFAAQDGLVDLDEPITTYLPDFRVHSIFEEHPEHKMTLRILLSHTAGFAHDPAFGGNNDNAGNSFEKHIASISDSWLMFPVGTRYSYSNIGIDLAGYILQKRSGMSFTRYVQEKVLDPLGMVNSTLELSRLRATATRAIGHVDAPLRPPVDFTLIPSGGVWTSAQDMAHYLQFHINKGAINDVRLLNENLAETMYTPPNAASLDMGYALGVTVGTRNTARHFQHGGGGFGFNSSMAWYPELKLGAVVLMNGHTNTAMTFQINEDVLDEIIASAEGVYAERAAKGVQVEPRYLPSRTDNILYNNHLEALIASKALPVDATAQERRKSYAGDYIVTYWGIPMDTGTVTYANGILFYTNPTIPDLSGQTLSLTEVEPGLFFDHLGDAFDARGPEPMVSNVRLVKANPKILPIKTGFYTACGLVLLSSLIFWPARAAIRLIRRKNSRANTAVPVTSSSRWLVLAGILAALASLFSLFSLVIIKIFPNLMYVPWPLPYVDLAWWQFCLMSMPFASLLLAVVDVGLLASLAIKNNIWKRSAAWYSIPITLVLFAFDLVVIL